MVFFKNLRLRSDLCNSYKKETVYVSDLPEGLTTSAKHFADDTSLFSVVYDSAASSAPLNDDLLKISRRLTSGR